MKKNYVINYSCGLLAVILLAVGIGVFMMNVKAPKAAALIEDTDISKVEMLDYYYGEFCIVDVYSYTGVSQDAVEEFHCYALIIDKYSNTQAVSFTVKKDDTMFNAVELYANSPNAAIGDLVIECYAKARNLKTWSPTILGYFNEITTEYRDTVGVTVSTPIDFEYYCGALSSFDEMRKAESAGPRIAATICTAIGGLLALAAFLIPGIEVRGSMVKAEPVLAEVKEEPVPTEEKEENTENE